MRQANDPIGVFDSGIGGLTVVKEISPVPVIGVVEPAVSLAVKTSTNQKIGVIGTQATVDSKIYEKEIKKILPEASVYTKSGSLFVPLVEEGLNNHFATWQIAKEYLDGFKSNGIDTLILGCTHFPLLTDVIQDIVGPDVTLVDSAKPTAGVLKQKLEELNLLNKGNHFITTSPKTPGF